MQMSLQPPTQPSSPWRSLFESVRRAAGGRRDDDGVQGSINWLRKQMEQRGANPNVVRNILYRDKGRLADKRVLFEILGELWQTATGTTVKAPEIEVLLAHDNDHESNSAQLLDREKRLAYSTFVGGVRSGDCPRLLVTGRPGSGKTLLIDYIQKALESPPRAAERIVRLEFSPGHVATGITRLGSGLGVAPEFMESKLAKIATSGAFAVQADAQAELARVLLEAVSSLDQALILLTHVSGFSTGDDSLGGAPLRLNTPEVPRVTAPEWLWLSLFEPLSRQQGVCLLLSMTDLPASAFVAPGGFNEPLKLKPPTVREARRFVRARLPMLDTAQQEALVRRSGRSYEELRTLTLLAEIREQPGATQGSPPEVVNEHHLKRLAGLVENAVDEQLRNFLAALAALSLPEFPTFSQTALAALRGAPAEFSSLERSFLDPVPPEAGRWRAFSRHFTRLLRHSLSERQPERYRQLHSAAAQFYQSAAAADPNSEWAARYVQHLLQGRQWKLLTVWLEDNGVQQASLGTLWETALSELGSGETFELIARHVGAHYLRLGSYEHPDALQALDLLSQVASEELRRWALTRRAEGAVLRGQVDLAESLLEQCPAGAKGLRAAEAALVRASIARWRSESDEAVRLVEEVARPKLTRAAAQGREGQVALAKAAVWSGLIAKDRCDLDAALQEFSRVASSDKLVEARVAFQQGDVLIAMGRFDGALSALDKAVRLARQNQALSPEQARYLARRAKLHRKRGELAASHADLDAAQVVINSVAANENGHERSYRLALVEEERALTLLAEGDISPAIVLLEGSIRTYEEYAELHALDASYRILRSTLRLVLAYLCRGLGQPFHLPYPGLFGNASSEPDLRHARTMHQGAERQLQEQGESLSYWPLRRRSFLLGSLLAEDPTAAAAAARCALAGSGAPYHRAESFAYLGLGALRANLPVEAVEHCLQAKSALATLRSEEEGSDLTLYAWLTCLQTRAHLQYGDRDAAALLVLDWLDEAHQAHLHEPVLRAFGEAAETNGPEGRLGIPRVLRERLGLLHGDALTVGRVRLPDELALRWKSLGAAAAEGERSLAVEK